MINVQFPGNAFMIYEVMITVVTFDILPTDYIYPLIFQTLPETEPFNSKFDRLSYNGLGLMTNMGTMLLPVFWYLLLYAMLPCFDFLKKDAKCAKKWGVRIRRSV